MIPRPENARLGRPPTWASAPKRLLQPTLDDVLAVVEHPPTRLPEATAVNGRPPAAVLALLYDGDEGPTLIFTRRSWKLRSHTGEVCFPGGRADPEDADLRITALRETEEEIGLHRDQVEILGELPRLTTVSSPAPIVPYIGLLDRRPVLSPSDHEVDAILDVSIAELLQPEIYREELWSRNGVTIEITFFELVEDTLWGATARMLRGLLERVTAPQPG